MKNKVMLFEEFVNINESAQNVKKFKTELEAQLKCKLTKLFSSREEDEEDEELGHFVEYMCKDIEIADQPLIIVVYENGTAHFFHDSTPYPISVNSKSEALKMSTISDSYPKPINFFTKKELDNIVRTLEQQNESRHLKEAKSTYELKTADFTLKLSQLKKQGKDIVSNAVMTFTNKNDIQPFLNNDLDNYNADILDWAVEDKGIINDDDFSLGFEEDDHTVKGNTVTGKFWFWSA
jgi:hypothetical protein